MGNIPQRILKLFEDPLLLKKRLNTYKKQFKDLQKGFVILQEFIEHDFEWRVVKIGDSYFGHQKVKMGDKASGSKGINYTPPPIPLLNFVEKTCLKHSFNTMAFDLFEDKKRGYLVNEMQCIFGHVQDHICELDGNPGRFIRRNDKWLFEKGLFNSNLSYDLRLDNALQLINGK